MSIGDEDFQTWLAARDVPRCYLVEAGYGVLVDDEVVEHTEYASLHGYISHATDTPATTIYPAILRSIPTLRFGADTLTVGEIEVVNDNGDRDDWLDRFWDGRTLRILIGGPGWARADFRTLLLGTLAGIGVADQATLILRVRDRAAFLDRPIQPNLYTEGTLKDQPKIIGLGFCYNVEPVHLPITDTSTYAVDLEYDADTGVATATASVDPGFAVGDVIEIIGSDLPYDDVVTVAATSSGGGSYVVSWQLDYPTDLDPATATMTPASLVYQLHDGEIAEVVDVQDDGVSVDFVADLEAGTVALAKSPGGSLRAHFRGGMFGIAYAFDCTTLVRWLFGHAQLSNALLDLDALADWATECPQPLAFVAKSEIKLAEAVRQLAASLDAYAVFSRAGKLRFWRVPATFGSPVATFTEADMVPGSFRPTDISTPNYKVSVGYQRNWNPIDAGTLAAGGLSPSAIAALATEYRTVSAEDAATRDQHLLATDAGQVDTLFSAEDAADALADATAERDRRMALYGVQRITYQVELMIAPARLNPGDVVEIVSRRWGFGEGLTAMVMMVEERPSEGRVLLEVWR